ncbi:MAG: CotH kinase family protein [Anaerolineae bacterium]|nr:CotH kinase family protein [Anaerolineae bacterium]
MLICLYVWGLLGGLTDVAAGWEGTLTETTVWIPADNPHRVDADLVVPAGVTLTIVPGVVVQLAPETSLLVHGTLRAVGTVTQPITFTWRDEDAYWGALAILSTYNDNRLEHVLLEYAGEEPDTSPRYTGVAVRHGQLTIADSLIRYTNGKAIDIEEDSVFTLARSEITHIRGDALGAGSSEVVIAGNHIHDIIWEDHNYEGLSLNEMGENRPALVRDNHIHHIADDCIDINNAWGTLANNRIHHCGDKGISMGALQGQYPVDSQTFLVNNLIYSATLGVAVKDGVVSYLLHNTLVDNYESGLTLYEVHQGYGGGLATVANTILWDNGEAITLDANSMLSVSFSDIEGGWPGVGNLDADPRFLSLADYRLMSTSPCRDAGFSPPGTLYPPFPCPPVLLSLSSAAYARDLDQATRPFGAIADIGAYEWPTLRLYTRAGDKAGRLNWHTPFTPALAHHYHLTYTTRLGGTLQWTGTVTHIPTTTLAYTLTPLANYRSYDIALALMDAAGIPLLQSNIVHLTPTDRWVYLPLIIKSSLAPLLSSSLAPSLISSASPRLYLPLILSQRLPPVADYTILIDPDDWAYLDDHMRNRDLMPAQFIHAGQVYDVGVRYRGEIARWLPKKSWKVEFDSSDLFAGRHEINLNAEYPDKSLLREWLAYDLFARVGVIAPQANFARLYVNDEYRGLFTEVDQVDQRFLVSVGLDPNGDLYKGDYGTFHIANTYDAYVEQYVKKINKEDSYRDLIVFIEILNETSQEELPQTLAALMDVGVYLDQYAVQVLIGNYEWVEKNFYIYHDRAAGRWQMIPWDVDLSFGHNHESSVFDETLSWDNPIDMGTRNSPKMDGPWNQLTTVILEDDAFRAAYCRRLRELLHGAFMPDVVAAQIEMAYRAIRTAGEADSHKWGTNEDFQDGPAELQFYVEHRRAWLFEQMEDYCPANTSLPVINEVMAENTYTVMDEAGEFEPWLEIYNPALVSIDLQGMQLVSPSGAWTFARRTILPPGGFLLLWADGELLEGSLHTSLCLNSAGGYITLLDKAVHGGGILDRFDYGPLGADISFGRRSDGSEDRITFRPATPGFSNLGFPPTITAVQQSPAEPEAGQPVWITATLANAATGAGIADAWVSFDAGTGVQTISMTAQVSDTYAITLPAQITGTVVSYTVHARNTAGLVAVHPSQPQSARVFGPRIFHRYCVGFHRPALYFNEVLAINDDGFLDEAGDTNDWFEIYNAGPAAVNLQGMYLTDAIENTTKWQITRSVTVPAESYVVFWADAEPGEGPTHIGFKLDGDGGRLALYAGDLEYNELIDEVYYPPQAPDIAFGRYPDVSGVWTALPLPTPGTANRWPPPTIDEVTRVPAVPQPEDTVHILARISDNDIVSVTLHYNIGTGWQSVAMLPNTLGLYAATIPSQLITCTVKYFVTAANDQGEIGQSPAAAPLVVFGYQVGVPTPVVLNELMADNTTTLADETGQYADWLELYNCASITVDVGGLYMSDDAVRPGHWQIPMSTTIAPESFLLIWADEDPKDGPLHATFKLNKDGEQLALLRRVDSINDHTAYILLDAIAFGPQQRDISYGRTLDGDPTWIFLPHASPGATNGR